MSEENNNEEAVIEEIAEEINNETDQDSSSDPDSANDKENEDDLPLAAEEEKDEENMTLDELPLPEREEKSDKEWIIARKLRKAEKLKVQNEELKRQLEANYVHSAPQGNASPGMSQVGSPNGVLTAPKRDDFVNDDDYIDARMEYKLAHTHQKMRDQQMQQAARIQHQATVKKYEDVLEKGSQKYEDFEEAVHPMLDPKGDFPPNPLMGEAITESPYGADIFYFLAKYPKQAREIASLSPVQAVKKVAELEQRFKNKKVAKKSVAKPKIIEAMSNGVGGKSGRRLEDMSATELDQMPAKEFSKLWKERGKRNPHAHF